jgi:hypothetical protein
MSVKLQINSKEALERLIGTVGFLLVVGYLIKPAVILNRKLLKWT